VHHAAVAVKKRKILGVWGLAPKEARQSHRLEQKQHCKKNEKSVAFGIQLLPERHQKAGNDLRVFRWGTVADHPDVINLHPALSCANNASAFEHRPGLIAVLRNCLFEP
jgi:hypothetical protein